MSASPRLRRIAADLGKPWHTTGCGVMVRCPSHEDRTPSLHLTETTNGRLRVRCFAGCCWRDVIAALRGRGLWPDGVAAAGGLVQERAQLEPDSTARLDAVRRIWRETRPAPGTLVEAYLRHRGLTLPPPPSLRFVPRLRHCSGCRPPAMVAAIQGPDGRLIGVHRTWLAPGGAGKADVEPNRMMLGRAAGGAVRLAPVAIELAVAEGVETALAVVQAAGMPAWAALSTYGLRALELPPEVRQVLIFADGDPPGEAAARAAANRWLREGRRVRIARPPAGMDANALLVAGAT